MKVNQLIERILHNWPQKLVCFVLALFLYLFYHMSLVDRKTVVIPLHVYQDGAVVASGNIPSSVKVVVRADKNTISSIHNSDLYASVNLNFITESGTYRLPVNMRVSDSILGFDPLEIKVTPELLEVTVEEKVSVPVPVEPVILGDLAKGYEITSVEVSPSYVTVTGPRSIVEKYSTIKTSVLDVNGVSKTLSQKVTIVNNNKMLGFDNISDYSVTVNVDTVKIEKEFEGIKLIPYKLSENLTIETEIPLLYVKLEGSQIALENFKLDAVNLSFEGITEEGEYDIPIRINLPRGVKILERSIETLKVQLRKHAVEPFEADSSLLLIDDRLQA